MTPGPQPAAHVAFDEPQKKALVELGRALAREGYRFVTVTPETHRRVDQRVREAGHDIARSLRDVFGWSRPFGASVLPARMLELARAAGILEEQGDFLKSRVRFSSLHGELFVHSAFPTLASDAVFFGPDTYRFCDLVAAEVRDARVVVDVGCGSGAGGVVAAFTAERVLLADVNAVTLSFAEVNATLAGVRDGASVVTVESNVLSGIREPFDCVIANPPYMVDHGRRAYRDGSGQHGEGLGVEMTRQAMQKLEPGGRLVLYTGAAIVDGRDTFLDAVRPALAAAGAAWRYREIDPDVFGEEISRNEAYADVERIAVVALVAEKPG